MSKKKKTTTNNKQKNKQKNEQLKELEDVIYTYPEKDLVSYFKKIFIYGNTKEHYQKNLALLRNLDMDSIDFAIARFYHLDNSLDPVRRNLMAVIPLFVAYLTAVFNVNVIKILGFLFVTISVLIVLILLNKDRKNRIITGYMLKTFEQVKARKEKDEE
ncbi:hypothetical protein [Bacillus pumilus]|uniref:hypothetical protein n=1 Tax=Bacillus pumilus TaxID=1408 RepID=UPI001C250E65|nr:hypothetical protein [Bacillus pumilus]MBU8576990.1 hypothetical protein [Bacillus pumilus]